MKFSPEGVLLAGNHRHLAPGQITARQAQVVGMFCSGMSYTQIGTELGLATGTIPAILKQAARRLGCQGISRAALQTRTGL